MPSWAHKGNGFVLHNRVAILQPIRRLRPERARGSHTLVKGSTLQRIHAASLAAFLTALVACGGSGGDDLATFTDSASYAIGMNMGGSVRRSQTEVAVPALMRGLSDALEDRTTAFTPTEANAIIQRFAVRAQEAQAADFTEAAQENLEKGEAFLTENGEKPGVVTTASGLQYQVLEAGDGPRPSADDRVSVHYRGTLIDGSEFDSSYRKGQPLSFAVRGVIRGWTEALQLMPVGSKYQLFIPADLAYGPRGSPPTIGPNATLIFEVELLAIE